MQGVTQSGSPQEVQHGAMLLSTQLPFLLPPPSCHQATSGLRLGPQMPLFEDTCTPTTRQAQALGLGPLMK